MPFTFEKWKILNNNFAFEEKMKNLTTISPIKKQRIKRQFPFQKKMNLMQQWKYFEINSSMIKKNTLNKHWTKFSFKGGRGR